MTLRALIFDVDGTLAETEEAHRQAFNESFAVFGLDWHWTVDDYRRLLGTTGGKERIRAFCEELRLPADSLDILALHTDKTRRYAEILAKGELKERPGVSELIQSARAAGLEIAVATTTNLPNVEALTRCLWDQPAEAIFDVIAAGDQVKHKKPAPDVYQLALDRLGLSPKNALAFEDSRNGLNSAKAAGLEVIITPSIYTDHEDFAGALSVVSSLHDFSL